MLFIDEVSTEESIDSMYFLEMVQIRQAFLNEKGFCIVYVGMFTYSTCEELHPTKQV